MSEKRKDSKGRVLKDGESQRANGTYDYRYTDIHKKRRCIYACLLYTSPSPRDRSLSRMPSSA